jgi:NAD+--asparagine ADP-ribosyltransferase
MQLYRSQSSQTIFLLYFSLLTDDFMPFLKKYSIMQKFRSKIKWSIYFKIIDLTI